MACGRRDAAAAGGGTMRYWRSAAALIALAAATGGGGLAAAPPVGDERAIPEHLDLDAILDGRIDVSTLLLRGRALFEARFTSLDGAGRPEATQAIVPTKRQPGRTPAMFRTAGPDANSCAGCHNQPTIGGAGDFVANVFVSEGFADAEFDTLDPQFSNERGSPALQGAGLVELLAREMTRDLQAIRAAARERARLDNREARVELVTKGVSFGHVSVEPQGFIDNSEIEGIDHDLVVRPFSQKGVFASLRQFTINALNVHHGMQATERFGSRWTDTEDFDGDGTADEISPGDVTAIVAFQAALPPPAVAEPDDPVLQTAVARGEAAFEAIGCGTCHRSALPLDSPLFVDPGPYDAAGTLSRSVTASSLSIDLMALHGFGHLTRDAEGHVRVPLFSDLKRHRIADADRSFYANELLSQRFVGRDEFLTPRLWGVGSTAPYGHRGDVTTLDEAIHHHGGEAAAQSESYASLEEDDRRAIIEFLKSLRIPEVAP